MEIPNRSFQNRIQGQGNYGAGSADPRTPVSAVYMASAATLGISWAFLESLILVVRLCCSSHGSVADLPAV